MNPVLRIPNEGDREPIRAALATALYRSLANSSNEESTVSYLTTNQEFVVEKILRGLVDSLVIDESYLLVYAVVQPWYSLDRIILSEEMVLRIRDGSSFDAVVSTMKLLAENNDCDAIVTGGALARYPRALTRLYQRHGFTLEDTPQLTLRRK